MIRQKNNTAQAGRIMYYTYYLYYTYNTVLRIYPPWPCPSQARRLSHYVRRIASSGRMPSLSRGAEEPGRLKLFLTSPFRGGCPTESIAGEPLSAEHGAWRWGLRAPSWTASGGAAAPPGTSARSDFRTNLASPWRTATSMRRFFLTCRNGGVDC